MEEQRSNICTKIGYIPKSCFFRNGYKNKTTYKNKNVAGKYLTKTWNDGRLQITTKASSKLKSGETLEKEDEKIFESQHSSLTSSVSVQTINISPNIKSKDHNEIALCNITEHQLFEKIISKLNAENALIKDDIKETKNPYVEEYSKAIQPSTSLRSLTSTNLNGSLGGENVPYTLKRTQFRRTSHQGNSKEKEVYFGSSYATEDSIEKFLRVA